MMRLPVPIKITISIETRGGSVSCRKHPVTQCVLLNNSWCYKQWASHGSLPAFNLISIISIARAASIRFILLMPRDSIL